MVYVALLEDITSVIDCILRYEYYTHFKNEKYSYRSYGKILDILL